MTEQESPLNFNVVKIKKRDDTTTTRWSGSGDSQWTALPCSVLPRPRYLLLHHARDALPGVLLGHLRGNAHLLLDVLLVLVLLLLGVRRLLHVLQPQLGQVDLTLVLAGRALARRDGRPSAHRKVGRLSGRRRRLLDHQVTCSGRERRGE